MPLTARSINGYAAVSPPNQVSLRSVSGYLIGSPPVQVGVRSIGGYLIGPAIKSLPKGVTGLQAVLLMIVAKANTVRPTTDFTAVAVEALTNDANYNARVQVKASAASGLKGTKWFRYNRVPISRMTLDPNNIPLGTATTIYEALSAISAVVGITLTVDDVVDGPISASAYTVELVAKSTSYWFIPGSKVTIGQTLPQFSTLFTDPAIRWS